ncbi:MAG TPA: hypothetical protein DDW81_11530 [Cryomorphaceae bacterium]|nr:hypothetical protein [Owenweeksia sp.]HBF20720.1 hypothetical protein [Cryomorphaceae bacterium]HCQ15529.1 hypothetical protein [Cryomorphaceae bacterium]|tara:strand:+ start:427 stop:873 length:447 start_codon:yes stop_codon:yes gene_type:complete
MTYDERIDWVKRKWPGASAEQAESLVFHSSYIVFDRAEEFLFRQGDAPCGFYWILSGSVRQFVGDQTLMHLDTGDMVGLEEFLQFRLHLFNWQSLTPVKALFMDRRCFEMVVGTINDHHFIYNQLSRQLLDLKARYHHMNTDHFSPTG